MDNKVVGVTEDLANYMQRLDYEISGYKVLINSAVSNIYPDTQYSKDNLEYIIGLYDRVNTEYRLAISELVQMYCPDEQVSSVTVDFDKLEVTFILGGRGCKCNG